MISSGHALDDVRRDREADADRAGLAADVPPADAMATLIPMSLPSPSTSAPPELPGVDRRIRLDDGDLDRLARRRATGRRRRSRTGTGSVRCSGAWLVRSLRVVRVGSGRRRDLDRTVQCAHDARRDRVRQSERRTDGDRLVADVEIELESANSTGVRPSASTSLMTARSYVGSVPTTSRRRRGRPKSSRGSWRPRSRRRGSRRGCWSRRSRRS